METGWDNSKYYKNSRRDNKEQTVKGFLWVLKCLHGLEAQREEHIQNEKYIMINSVVLWLLWTIKL